MSALLLLTCTLRPALAVDLALVAEEEPWPGVVLRTYRASEPSTDVTAAFVDLCADGVHVDATSALDAYATTGSWALDRGVQLASNGDFYKTNPTRVYGNAVGEGVSWPLEQTGDDPDYSSEWYFERYGWIAFLHDSVTFTHTEYTKLNREPTTGWAPDEVAPAAPPGTLALVSGFPEIVVDGEAVTCSSPTASDCFTDRSDMRDRNPRTAMGLTEDMGTFILVAVDGRTSSNSGMYGAELADTMHQLGAWVAFNIDGGGSTQLWADGYLNDYSGNNSGGSARSVANHWGVFAGTEHALPQRPGHCSGREPCGLLPAGGGVIDDADACFQLFGPDEWWREEDAGWNGHLYWTNAWDNSQALNWAWWRFEFAEAGTYEVELYVEPGYGVHDEVDTLVVADGVEHRVVLDHSSSKGWIPVGSFDFAAGGAQFLASYDDTTSNPGSNQHVVADAVRLTRVGPWCGDGTCGGAEDCGSCPDDCPPLDEVPDNGRDDDCDGEVDETSGVDDTADPGSEPRDSADGSPDSGEEPRGGREPRGGCGCGWNISQSDNWAAWLLLVGLARRRKAPGKRARPGPGDRASLHRPRQASGPARNTTYM